MWVLFIFIALIVVGIVILKNENKKQSKAIEISVEPPAPKEQTPVEQFNISTDSTKTDSATISVTDFVTLGDKNIDSSHYISPDPSKFYLIGGSFKDAENAEKYLQRIKDNGYEPFHLGKHGNFYFVGFEIHDNEIEAYGAQYNFLDKYPDSGAWIFIPE